MRNEKDGSIQTLQRMIAERILPVLEKAENHSIRLAFGNGRAEFSGQRVSGPLERHPFTEVCVCISGKAEVCAGESLETLAAGDVLVIPPGTIHSGAGVHCLTASLNSAFSRLLWVSVFPYGCILNMCESIHGTHQSTPRQVLLAPHVHYCIQDLIVELKNAEINYERLAKLKLLEAFLYLYRGEQPQMIEASFREMRQPEDPLAPDASLCGRTAEFIQQHFDSQLDLDTIVQAISSSKSHLCRAFKGQTGYTPIEYLTKVRIDASKRLLLAGLPVSTVARLVGFQDPYYFSRVFRRLAGSCPTDFSVSQKPDEQGPHCEGTLTPVGRIRGLAT